MTRVWIVKTSAQSNRAFIQQELDGKEPLSVAYPANRERLDALRRGTYAGLAGKRPTPAAKLKLMLDDAGPDFFLWDGASFVSERMRKAMALDSSDVRFLEVDDSLSSPLVRSTNYQIMEVGVMDDVSDGDRSDYDMVQTLLDKVARPAFLRGLAIRPNAAPTHDLFYDSFFDAVLLCTDSLALRVLESGCTGMRFLDPRSSLKVERQPETFYRTLRGVERLMGQNPDRGDITEVVEVIDRGGAAIAPAASGHGAASNLDGAKPVKQAVASRGVRPRATSEAPRAVQPNPPTSRSTRTRKWRASPSRALGSDREGGNAARIWRVGTSFANQMVFVPRETDAEPPIDVSHHVLKGRSRAFARGMYTGRTGDRPVPAATLMVTREEFGPDYFTWGGSKFVSERLRQAMALGSSDIRFLEVDDSSSAPLTRSRHYRIMEVYATEDVSDPGKSDYDMIRLLPDMPVTPATIRRLAFRPSATPTRDLFQDLFFSTELLCTESFALRVLETGCTGMLFEDPTSFGSGEPLYRTLRGVEKLVGHDPNYREITELVEVIDRGAAAR